MATFEALRIAERRRRQRNRFIDANECEVGIGIVADQPCMQILAIGGRDFNAGRGTGNMTVGEDQPIGRHDDARTSAAARLTALARLAGIAVKYCKPHDCGADTLDDVDDRPRIADEL